MQDGPPDLSPTEIQGYQLFRKLQDRLKVIASGSGRIFLSRVVTPVVDLDKLAEDWGTQSSGAVSWNVGEGDSKDMLTVPRGIQRKVHIIRISRQGGGPDNLIVNMQFADASTGQNTTFDDHTAVPVAELVVVFNTPVVLNELDSIKLNTGAGTGSVATDFFCAAWVSDTKAFAV